MTELDDEIFQRELVLQRARRDAREALEREQRARVVLPTPAMNLRADLTEHDEPVKFVVRQLLPEGGNVVLAAKFKTGKSTTAMNLARSLVDDVPFLDAFPIDEPVRGVGFWNLEMTRTQCLSWFRDLQVGHDDRVAPWHLRGSPFDLMEEHVFEVAAGFVASRQIDFLIIDTYAAAFHGEENSNRDVARFLARIDELKEYSVLKNVLITAHFGRADSAPGHEHARGATRLDDWADARWILAKGRHSVVFRASGRDVDVPPVALSFDASTRRMRVAGPAEHAETQSVLDVVIANPGIKKNDLLRKLLGRQDSRVAAVATAIDGGVIRVERDGNSLRHYPAGGQ